MKDISRISIFGSQMQHLSHNCCHPYNIEFWQFLYKGHQVSHSKSSPTICNFRKGQDADSFRISNYIIYTSFYWEFLLFCCKEWRQNCLMIIEIFTALLIGSLQEKIRCTTDWIFSLVERSVRCLQCRLRIQEPFLSKILHILGTDHGFTSVPTFDAHEKCQQLIYRR